MIYEIIESSRSNTPNMAIVRSDYLMKASSTLIWLNVPGITPTIESNIVLSIQIDTDVGEKLIDIINDHSCDINIKMKKLDVAIDDRYILEIANTLIKAKDEGFTSLYALPVIKTFYSWHCGYPKS